MVKTMKSPPEVIKLVLAAVCVMLNIPPVRKEDLATGTKVLDYWTPSKRMLGDIKFLDSLRLYDKDNIPEPIMQVSALDLVQVHICVFAVDITTRIR